MQVFLLWNGKGSQHQEVTHTLNLGSLSITVCSISITSRPKLKIYKSPLISHICYLKRALLDWTDPMSNSSPIPDLKLQMIRGKIPTFLISTIPTALRTLAPL